MAQKIEIIFCEAETGIILNEDGTRWQNNSGVERFNPLFNTLEDALKLKDILLEKNPLGEVTIKVDEKLQVFRNDKYIEKYFDERKRYYKWKELPFFKKWFIEKPKGKIFKT